MPAQKNKTIEQRVNKKWRELKKEFSFKDDSKRQRLADGLTERAAFMCVTLEDLEAQIKENGVVSEYKNGENQYGTKKSPEVEVYNTMVKNYAAVLKQLADLLPEEKTVVQDDGFEAFRAFGS